MANEKRLIDANEAKKLFDDIPPFIGMTGNCVQKMLDTAPTVDAVEVVRKPVRGYEGRYVVDQFGRVFGVDRTTTGEEQPKSKLTKKAVKDVRWERAYKGTSYQMLADRYGVSKKTIMNAIKGVTWKCVPYMPEPPKGE